MTYLWCVGQLGIGLELVGALLVANSLWRGETQLQGIRFDTYEGIGRLQVIADEVAGQFRKQLPGFVLLGFGLLGQLAGNFGQVR